MESRPCHEATEVAAFLGQGTDGIYNGTVEEFKIAGVDGDRMRHHSGHQSVK